jgi:hypothetical protein
MVHHLLNYNYHRNLQSMTYRTHMTIKHLVQFDFYSLEDDSTESAVLEAQSPQTGEQER